jgi:hypothetical protein
MVERTLDLFAKSKLANTPQTCDSNYHIVRRKADFCAATSFDTSFYPEDCRGILGDTGKDPEG